ncbi:hypothetical protein CEXT_460991 [Caerostris extrusa]|uniref:Uncharacterized protein n=1 Tax=Caerostris extrusa TaxID=172846 RepID=A0AAV4MUY1_CAEEX|nr:hypothetical protein CEXT_460991 [Caerostris extrusa]
MPQNLSRPPGPLSLLPPTAKQQQAPDRQLRPPVPPWITKHPHRPRHLMTTFLTSRSDLRSLIYLKEECPLCRRHSNTFCHLYRTNAYHLHSCCNCHPLLTKPRKRKSTATPSISVNRKIKTNNSFATLSDLETEDELATNISTMAIQNTKQPVKQKPKQPAVTPQTNTSTVTPTNPISNVRPIMITKPTDTITFMLQINNDLKFTINCKHTASYLKIEPDT